MRSPGSGTKTIYWVKQYGFKAATGRHEGTRCTVDKNNRRKIFVLERCKGSEHQAINHHHIGTTF